MVVLMEQRKAAMKDLRMVAWKVGLMGGAMALGKVVQRVKTLVDYSVARKERK